VNEFDEDAAMAGVRRGSSAPWLLFLLAAAVAGAGYYYYDRMELPALTERASKAETAAVEAKNELQAQSKARTDLEARADKLEKENQDLRAEKTRLSKDVEAKEGELERLKATTVALEEKMKIEIGRGDIRITQVGGKIQVDLVDKILFDSGDAKIAKRGEEVLSRVGAVLAKVEDKQIQVSGHTDDQPISEKLKEQFPTNWELSVARATNVVRFLDDSKLVPPARLVVTGYGPFQPIATNATPKGRARNRRIEILLVPLIQPVAAHAAQKRGR
jgi:chemotaxis protein MotB